uniref:Uncharacterized protein n=1 Tax=Arundo donax TaxID=35708 RepID=A0A0A8YLM2_ARUDO
MACIHVGGMHANNWSKPRDQVRASKFPP